MPKPIKKLVTQLQMFQFLTMNGQAIYMLYFKCPYPSNITWFYLVSRIISSLPIGLLYYHSVLKYELSMCPHKSHDRSTSSRCSCCSTTSRRSLTRSPRLLLAPRQTSPRSSSSQHVTSHIISYMHQTTDPPFSFIQRRLRKSLFFFFGRCGVR